MLHILDRNMRIKEKPEKFQESVAKYNVILTCEEKNYDAVVEHFESGESSHSHLAHVINLDIVSCHPCSSILIKEAIGTIFEKIT